MLMKFILLFHEEMLTKSKIFTLFQIFLNLNMANNQHDQ